jgi:hypothetical protein
VESTTEPPVLRPAYHANGFPRLKLKLNIPDSGINSHYIFRTDANHKRECPDCKTSSEPMPNMFLSWRLNHPKRITDWLERNWFHLEISLRSLTLAERLANRPNRGCWSWNRCWIILVHRPVCWPHTKKKKKQRLFLPIWQDCMQPQMTH